MKNISLLLILLLPLTLSGQYEINLDWVIKNQTNDIGGGAYFETPKVLADTKGGVYYCGTTYHPGPATGLLIIHYDQEGTLLWSDTLDDTSIDQLAGAVIDKDGNLIIAMNSKSPFGFYGIFQVFKYNQDGSYAWEYLQYQQNTPWQIGNLLIDEQDFIYLFCSWVQPVDSLNNGLSTLKLSGETGQLIWENILTDSLASYNALKGAVLDDRLIVLARKNSAPRKYILHQLDLNGQSIQTLENDYPGDAEFNDWAHIDQRGNTYLGVNAWGYRLAKITPSGDTAWVYERAPSNAGIVRNRMVSINSDDSYNIYATGSYYNDNEFLCITTTKLNPDKTIIWQKDFSVIPNKTHEFPNRTYILDSILFIVGSTQQQINTDSSNIEFLLVAYSLDGEELFHQTYDDGIRFEDATSASFHKGTLFMAGYNDYPWPDETSEQYVFKYTIDIDTKTTQPISEELECNVFPNPVIDGFFKIDIPNQQALQDLKIFDATGKSVLFMKNKNNISISNLPAGLYFLEIEWENGKEIHKVIKQ